MPDEQRDGDGDNLPASSNCISLSVLRSLISLFVRYYARTISEIAFLINAVV